jgi:hypothetical protein
VRARCSTWRRHGHHQEVGCLVHLRRRAAGPGSRRSSSATRHADRRRRLPGPEGQGHRRSRRPRGSTSCSAPTTSARCRCCSSARATTARRRSRSRGARGVPLDAADPPRVGVRGWVSISVGCNNTCTFCIVPALRGKEKDRRPGDILAEVQALVDQGVLEVTLLGQNVNAYGVEFGDRRPAFAKLLRACGEIDGLERVRFTSPHPAAFTDDVIDAMAETPNVMPQLHMPLQSGSDRVLKAMRRSYRSERSSSASSTGCAPPSRTPPSPPTSSSASPARPRRTSRTPSTWSRRPGSPAPSPSSTRSGRAPRPRRCPTRCPRRSCRSATSASIDLQERDLAGRRTSAFRSAARSRCWSPRARAARTPRRTGCRAAPATTGWCTSPAVLGHHADQGLHRTDRAGGPALRAGGPR